MQNINFNDISHNESISIFENRNFVIQISSSKVVV